ncbi:hypothetical protein A3D11_03660 [Candidatus Peribacteria bacterium RIFCSPHIGHO2_02_FULL_49_16]|nr:MAG: hypothetical protein A2880_04620 [Candidatus Peribacteria bacterium RIFCSPHIGHO2_01_FULL_49_38]OGJ58830.1 MAG: hypothetical protein A3D11_03660 [Candidatus Peribacteria bacterium RIFCSPHIGHO2_02_FULL_49_16]
MAKNIFLSLLVLLLMLLLSEGAWRILFSRGDVHRVYDRELGRVNPPNTEWTMRTPEYTTHIRTNSRGFRGQEFPVKDRDNELRILFIGDSFVEAKQVPEHERFVEQLGQRLEERLGRPITVRALGIGGADPVKELVFYRNLGRTFEADYVVQVLFAENDLVGRDMHFIASRNEHGKFILEEIWPEAPPDCSWKCVMLKKSEIIRRTYLFARTIKQKNQELALHTLLRDFIWYTNTGQKQAEEERFALLTMFARTMREEVERDGGRYIALLMPGAFEIHEEWREEVIEEYRDRVSREEWNPSGLLDRIVEEFSDISVLDLRPAFLAQAKQGHLLYYKLDPHLNEYGHDTVTDALLKAILSL